MGTGSYNGFPASTASTLIGDTLAPNVVNSSLTQVGTISSGIWHGTAVADGYIASAGTWNAKQVALVSGINIKTFNGTSLLGSGDIVFNSNVGQLNIPYPVDKTYEVLSYAAYGFIINQLHNLRVSSGSCTLSVLINSTPVTGLNNLAVTTTPQSPIATGSYTVVVGDVVNYVISNMSNPTDLLGTLQTTRTG